MMKWTELPDATGLRMTQHSGTWLDLLGRLRTAGTFARKSECPWVKLAVFGTKRTKNHSLRHDANVLEIHGIEADYDNGLVTLEEAVTRLERHGLRAALYPSPSSTAEKPRWRVLCPLAKPHPPGARAALVARLNGALGGILSAESFTLSQSYYFGGTPTNDYVVLITFGDPDEGHFIDDQDELDQIAIGRPSGGSPAPGTPGKPLTIGAEMFEDAVHQHGRLLKTGDGRREMLKTYIASRSARGAPAGDLRAMVAGIAAQYFDPADPMDGQDVEEIVQHFVSKDYVPAVDLSALLPVSSIDAQTGEIIPTTPAAGDEPQEVSIADLATFVPTPPQFWADEILPADVVTLLGAHGGTGKTMLSLYAAVCLAMGLPFLGKQTKPARVLFYSAEDDALLLRWRLAMACQRLNVDPVALSRRLCVIDASEADSVMYVEASRNGVKVGEPTRAFQLLIDRMAAHRSQVVILDNASDIYGADEINRKQVRGFIRLLNRLARSVHGAVLLLTHVDKLTARNGGSQGYSGSTAWHNSVRSRLFLSEDATGGLLLEHQKSNRGKKAQPIHLCFDDGLIALAQQRPGQHSAQPLLDALTLTPVLTMMDEFYRRGEYISTSHTAHNNAHRALSSERGFPKVTKSELQVLLRDAERQGLIEREDYRDQHRKDRQRWRVKSAPSAPSAPSLNEVTENAGGAPSAPSSKGGMGGRRSAKEGAKPPRKQRAKITEKVPAGDRKAQKCTPEGRKKRSAKTDEGAEISAT